MRDKLLTVIIYTSTIVIGVIIGMLIALFIVSVATFSCPKANAQSYQPNPKLFHSLAAVDLDGCSNPAWAAAPIIRIRWPKTPEHEFSSNEQVHEFLKKLTKGKRWDLNTIEYDYTFIWRLDVETQIYFIQVSAIKKICREGEEI